MTDYFEDADHDFRRPSFAVSVGEWVREVPGALQGPLADLPTPGTGEVHAFDETSGLITSLSVDQRMDGADRCDLSLGSRFDQERAEFVDVDWEVFSPGRRLEVALGYAEDREVVFTGSITEIGTDFPAGGAPTISVAGLGHYNELTTNTTEDNWDEAEDDAEIAEELAAEYDLEAAVDGPGDRPEDAAGGPAAGGRGTQTNEYDSDAAFLDELAERNVADNGQYEAFVHKDTLYFRAPRDDRSPILTLTYGESLGSFSPEFSDANAHERVEVRHWDPDAKEPIVGVAEHDGGAGTRILRVPVASEEEATAIAEATLSDQHADRRHGRGETVGLPELKLGEPIELAGLGERFSGQYYVEAVTHRFDGSGFTTEFTARVPAAGVNP